MIAKEITVKSHSGLHNRQATLFVQKANEFECNIQIQRGTHHVNAKSLLGVMCLCVQTGDAITISVDGVDEELAIESLTAFFVTDII